MNAEQNAKSASRLKLGIFAALALTAFLTLTATPALAARGHVFGFAFASPGSGPGQLKEPAGLTVDEASGDVYVADAGNNRIQRFSSAGVFQSEITGIGATGTGTLASGSKIVTALTTTTGAFVPGEEITAPGLTVATKIVKVTSATELELSQAATASETASLSAHQDFHEPGTLAVDNACRLHKPPLTEVTTPKCKEFDPSNGDLYVAVSGADEVQRYSPPISGEYTLSFEGQTTAPLLFSATGAEIEAALVSLSTVGAGNVAVEKNSSEAFIHFKGTLAEKDVEQIAASGGSPPPVVSTFSQGRTTAVDKFSPSGEFLGQITFAEPAGGFRRLLGVAVDPAGHLWVSGQGQFTGEGAFDEFTNALANQLIPPVRPMSCPGRIFCGFFLGIGLAVDSADNLYNTTGFGGSISKVISKFNSAGELLTRALDEETSSGVAVEAASDDVYVNNLETVARFGPGGGNELERLGAGHLPTRAEVEAVTPVSVGNYRAGLAVNSGLAGASTVYVADGVHGQIVVFPPEPPGPPTVETTSVSAVTANSADFRAEVNPRSEPFEAPTTYRFEYGPCETPSTCASSPYESSVPVPAASLAANYEVDPVSTHLQSLTPHTAYHLRVSAENSHSLSPTLGPERTFTTQPIAAFTLPDSRAWELVSPPDKHGALLKLGGTVFQAAAGGGGVAYTATSPTESEPQGYTNFVQVLAGRATAGWSSRVLAPPHIEATGQAVGQGAEYRVFSTDLSRAAVQPFGAFTPQISPAASEQTAFLTTNFASGQPTQFCTSSCYRPLVTGCPAEEEGGEPCPAAIAALADVPPGTEFGGVQGGGSKCPPILLCGPFFLAASPDLGHLVLQSLVPLTSNPAKGQLYGWSASAPPAEALRLISLLPSGAAAKAPTLGRNNENTRNAISADGSRVVFTSGAVSEAVQHLYLRVNASEEPTASGECSEVEPTLACTIQLDALQGGPGGPGTPIFQLASADGSKVFFTDGSRLTADSSPGGGDLYEYDLSRPLGQRLVDLTAGAESTKLAGTVIGASADGDYLYFAAGGVLATNTAENGNGPEQAQPGECNGEPTATCNLYLRHAGATTFLATLSGADFHDWLGLLTQLTARVSPNGRWLAFVSQRPLTGYDNRDAETAKRDQEAFLYHAPAGGGAGKLVCASCNPTGARPRGTADLPGWVEYKTGAALYQPRYLSDSGRLFLNSADALVAQDTNGTGDVYQYEPDGVGGCAASLSTFVPASLGCVDLISSGTSKEESNFLDASESGDDTFFLTASQLDPSRDADTSLDLYDARAPHVPGEAVGFLPPVKAVECSGDACQSPAVPPNDATPGSLTFSGAGNLLECTKGKALEGGKCVARKQKKAKKKHHKQSKKHHAKTNRGTGK